MKGKVDIVVQTSRVHYEMTLNRNITVITGNSGTGKTTLIDLLFQQRQSKQNISISVQCSYPIYVLVDAENENIEKIRNMKDGVFFADEAVLNSVSNEFFNAILESSCYFVLVTRDKLDRLPYSVTEIYGIQQSKHYEYAKQTYNSLFRLYPREGVLSSLPEIVITEDSNSGYEMFSYICKKFGVTCISAEGKSNIRKLLFQYRHRRVLAIADGAAFGADISDTIRQLGEIQNVTLWLPESFEYLLLRSGIFRFEGLEDMLENPADYIESKQFASWERYFTWYLIENTKNDLVLAYNKHMLNKNYLTQGNLDKFIKLLPAVLQAENLEQSNDKDLKQNKLSELDSFS